MLNQTENILHSQLVGQQAVDTVQDTAVIPVIHEELQISSREIETGRIQIRKEVEEEIQRVDLAEMHEETDVQRIPLNQVVDEAPAVRYEGDTMIVPVLREELVVQKRLILVEEVHIRKRSVHTTRTENVPLRKETIIVDRQAVP